MLLIVPQANFQELRKDTFRKNNEIKSEVLFVFVNSEFQTHYTWSFAVKDIESPVYFNIDTAL